MPLEWDTNGNGKPSLKEMNDWSRTGGDDITVDAEKVDFSKSDVEFHINKKGIEVAYAHLETDNPFNGGMVYGTLELRKGDASVKIESNDYDFKMNPVPGHTVRNIATVMGRIWAGPFPMKSFTINFNGNANLNYSSTPSWQYIFPRK